MKLILLTLLLHNAFSHESDFDFVVRLNFDLNKSTAPQLFSNLITHQVIELNLTTTAIIDLLKLRTLTYEQATVILNGTGKTVDKNFIFDNLQRALNATETDFKDFFNELCQNLEKTVNNFMEVLPIVHVDPSKFSLSIWGMYDVYEVLKEGTYTQEELTQVFGNLSVTKQAFFEASRNLLLKLFQATSIESLDKKFSEQQKDDFEKTINNMNITYRDFVSLEIISELEEEIIKNFKHDVFGIVSNLNEISLNREAVEGWNVPNRHILLEAINVNDPEHIAFIENFQTQDQNGIVKLKGNFSFPNLAKLANSMDSLKNCSFPILPPTEGSRLVSISAPNVTFKDNNIIAYINDISLTGVAIPLGTPLVCESEVHGLATDIGTSWIIFHPIYTHGEGINSAPISMSAILFNLILALLVLSL